MLHLDAAAVRARLPMSRLVPALRDAFGAGCTVPPRHSHAIGNAGTLLVMPAWREGGRLGVKTVNIFAANGALGLPAVHAVYALFDASTGAPLAVLDGSELTARRTAAVSALAAGFLAHDGAASLLVVGAGRVASLLADAMRSVRPGIQRVMVWGRNPSAAATLADRLCAQGVPASATTDLQAAVRQADIVSCATLSTTALIRGDWLRPGSHLDLVGSFTPAMREADGHCLARSRVFVDTEEALTKSGDVLQAAAEGHFSAGQLQGTLAGLCRGDCIGRHGRDDITLFKSVGTALADLAAAELALADAALP